MLHTRTFTILSPLPKHPVNNRVGVLKTVWTRDAAAANFLIFFPPRFFGFLHEIFDVARPVPVNYTRIVFCVTRLTRNSLGLLHNVAGDTFFGRTRQRKNPISEELRVRRLFRNRINVRACVCVETRYFTSSDGRENGIRLKKQNQQRHVR